MPGRRMSIFPIAHHVIGGDAFAASETSAHEVSMNTLLIILLVMAMAGVLGVLVAGMVGLVRGGGDPARSNRLMRWRVILQFAALALFALLLSLLGR
ncbi:protein of unknown function [Rhodovastum atsumiense]|nr:protein of unknown function [Rhodovastum atsumiense]